MTTSRLTPFFAEIVDVKATIPEEKLVYFRARLKARLHAFVIAEFSKLQKEVGFNRATLARRLGKRPEVITRLIGTPGNWEVNTLSDLLLGMGIEPTIGANRLENGAIEANQEHWRTLRNANPMPFDLLARMSAANENSSGVQRLGQLGALQTHQRQPFKGEIGSPQRQEHRVRIA